MLNVRSGLAGLITEADSNWDIFRFLLDFADILLLSLLLYICVRFMAGIMRKRSGRLLVGIFAVAALFALSYLLDLKATFFVLENIMQFGVIALVVIFQPELRTLLENVGYAGKKLRGKTLLISQNEKVTAVDDICKAVEHMSRGRVGALMIFMHEREINPYDEMKAVTINADVSEELIENIFFKNSPLHDGAVVIANFRVLRARVLFDELSVNPDLALNLGSRHKAGVGATEGGSDSSAVIVSEETGQISYARDGELRQNITPEELRAILLAELITESEDNKTARSKETEGKDKAKNKNGEARKSREKNKH